jgi:molybdopterin-containing oxidoreductase family membrane subunit
MSGATTRQRLLPRANAGWYVIMALALGAIGLGVVAYYIQYTKGYIVTGMRNPGHGGAAWGLYIAFDVFFVGVSFAGITVASMARLFHLAVLKPLTRLAELLTITALLAGACMVLSDLGRPIDGLLKLPELARPSSPFFGTFTLVVAGYLFSSMVFFFVSGRRDAARMAREGHPLLRPLYWLWASGYRGTEAEHARHGRTSFWLALTIMPLLVVAHSTLGFIFGIQAGRPGWYSALMAPGFVIMAGASGIGALIIMAVVLRQTLGLRKELPDDAIQWLGNLLWVLALVYIYFTIVEELTATYAGPLLDRHVAHEIVTGRFAPSFWITISCLFVTFLLPFLLFIKKKRSTAVVLVASLAANVAAVLKRLLIVVPSQTDGAYLPLAEGHYAPVWIEWAIVAGAGGIVVVSILGFARIFPISPGHQPPLTRSTPLPPDRIRGVVTAAWAAISVVLIVVGLTDSFRLWSADNIDPTIPFSPVIFATGVMMLFTSAVVYELLPSQLRRSRGPRIVDRARTQPMPPRTRALASSIRATERNGTSNRRGATERHHPPTERKVMEVSHE